MHSHWIDELEQKSGLDIQGHKPISGGDISDAFLLETKSEKFFLKTNASQHAHDLYVAEKLGLAALDVHPSIRVPQVLGIYQLKNRACLLMEFIASKRPEPKDWQLFGASLAELHQQEQAYFGWQKGNFIGVLPQSNQPHDHWVEFYVSERLWPQLKLARAKHLLSDEDCPQPEQLWKGVQAHCSDVRPSLLHGDLWGGNFLFDEQGKPCLIDPATYYGDSEVDLAMSRLFGGFHSAFYEAYAQKMPEREGAAQRQDLYQLYYLLVHLNLFGASYHGSVKRLLEQYFY